MHSRSFGRLLGVAALGAIVLAANAARADGNTNGVVNLTVSAASVDQTTGIVTFYLTRSVSTLGPVSVNYTTVDGTAVAGADYTAKSGTIYWNTGTANLQSFNVLVNFGPAFSGTRTFSVVLSHPGGGAELGVTNYAKVTILGAGTPPCAPQVAAPYTTTNAFDYVQIGDYIVSNNNWGGTPGQELFVNSENCWGVTTNAILDRYGIGSYPSVTRGWTQNQTALGELSSPGTNDWTVKSGMGIPVTALTKARVHWAFSAPPAPNRWSALMDIYFHKTNAPTAAMFYPQIDLMVEPQIADQVNSDGSTYYGHVIASNHGTQVNIGGNSYLVYVDNPQQVFNQPGGHTIEMFMMPTSNASPGLAVWGADDSVTDVAAIIRYWMQPNPLDVSGNAVTNAAGVPITAPIIDAAEYLNVINAGFEIDTGTEFTTTAFCVAMQSEPDCQ